MREWLRLGALVSSAMLVGGAAWAANGPAQVGGTLVCNAATAAGRPACSAALPVARPAAPTCPAPSEATAVACENENPGDPRTDWLVQGAGDPFIQGFATQMSVD
ncbi:MAG TPA: hypothetical protein VKY26_09780, partial [Actinomycetota bacterium]|nr:hypothetical protein [Actinomycetota bacterium]